MNEKCRKQNFKMCCSKLLFLVPCKQILIQTIGHQTTWTRFLGYHRSILIHCQVCFPSHHAEEALTNTSMFTFLDFFLPIFGGKTVFNILTHAYTTHIKDWYIRIGPSVRHTTWPTYYFHLNMPFYVPVLIHNKCRRKHKITIIRRHRYRTPFIRKYWSRQAISHNRKTTITHRWATMTINAMANMCHRRHPSIPAWVLM